MIRPVPDSKNAFQLQITNFASQKALLSIQGQPGVILPITNTPTKVSEVLIQNGLSIDTNNITQIKLHRAGHIYEFSLDDLLAPSGPVIYLQPNDHISSQALPYIENKVFILGGVSPQIFKINPGNRETLADVLFTSGGPLKASKRQKIRNLSTSREKSCSSLPFGCAKSNSSDRSRCYGTSSKRYTLCRRAAHHFVQPSTCNDYSS